MLSSILSSFAENYLLNGGQESQINYQLLQEIEPARNTKMLLMSYVVPKSYKSPSYNQKIQNFSLTFSKRPYKREKKIDKRGNEVITATWKNPLGIIKAKIEIIALNSTKLYPLQTQAPFPLERLPSKVKVYLKSTEQVPSNHQQIADKAKQLTSSATTEFDAVQQILTWIVDLMNYVLRPQDYGAIYSLQTGKGNCQNYSHLAATLMRSVGIPVRVINGVTLKEGYDIRVKNGYLTMRMAQGRHSWIEVYFPDLGWVPFDPQQMQLFVSNRFIRIEEGLDNNETISDGCVRWRMAKGVSGKPKFQENITAQFLTDKVELTADKQSYGPKKMLFTPPVESFFTEVLFEEAAAGQTSMTFQPAASLKYNEPMIIGNLEFPANINFFENNVTPEETEDGDMLMRKNFLVETAEYVTTEGRKFAQTFILKKPMKVEKVSLALHKFGGSGQLWIEILKDNGQGKPGEYLSASEIININEIKYFNGYKWIDFIFSPKGQIDLSTGRYWIALAYTGSPIINWFFTYGKPVGPSDGTRYNTMFDETWSRSLAYEFNYRVVGKEGK
jgi:hypothetical protein